MGSEGWNAGFATPLFSQGSLQNIVSQLCFLLLFSVFVCLHMRMHVCVARITLLRGEMRQISTNIIYGGDELNRQKGAMEMQQARRQQFVFR